MAFKLKIEPEVKFDIQDGINWYNKQKPGLGKTFHKRVKETFEAISINPFYQIRYNDIVCLPMKNYPFMVHFSIDEERKEVTIHALFNTYQNPKKWTDRIDNQPHK